MNVLFGWGERVTGGNWTPVIFIGTQKGEGKNRTALRGLSGCFKKRGWQREVGGGSQLFWPIRGGHSHVRRRECGKSHGSSVAVWRRRGGVAYCGERREKR